MAPTLAEPCAFFKQPMLVSFQQTLCPQTAHRPGCFAMPLAPWLQSARLPAHPTIAFPLLLGACVAWSSGSPFSFPWFLFAHGFGVLFHLLTVWVNDLSDAETDALQPAGTQVSGGSRVLVDGQLTRKNLELAAAVATASILLAGAYAATVGRPLAPLGFLSAVLVLLAYSWPFSARSATTAGNPPWRGLAHRGHGEWMQVIGVGALLPAFGFYFQTGSADHVPLRMMVPASCLALASHIATALPDENADRTSGKSTVVVRLGGRLALRSAAVTTGLGAVASTLLSHPGTDLLSMASVAWFPMAGVLPLLWLCWARRPLAQSLSLLVANQVVWIGWCIALTVNG